MVSGLISKPMQERDLLDIHNVQNPFVNHVVQTWSKYENAVWKLIPRHGRRMVSCLVKDGQGGLTPMLVAQWRELFRTGLSNHRRDL